MSFPETPLFQREQKAPSFKPPDSDLHEPIDDFPFDHPVKEERFRRAWHILKTTVDIRAKPNWWLFVFIVVIYVFVLIQPGNLDFMNIGMLLGVMLLHETGHFVTMKWFGYTDVRLFFIPFFGAAVVGKKHAAPAWQQAIVILMGPLPGLVLGMGWYLAVRDEVTAWELHTIALLLGLNALNLLPFEPFDGGRLLNLILFSRNAWTESLVQILGAAGIGLAAYLAQNYFLWILVVFTLLAVPFRFRKGLMIARLRRDGLQMPQTIAELEPLHGRMLFAAAYDVMGTKQVSDGMMANIMRELHDRVLVPAPGIVATCLFLLLYMGGLVMAVGTVVVMGYDIAELNQQLVEQQGKAQIQKAIDALAVARERTAANKLQGEAREKALQKVAEKERALQRPQGVDPKVMHKLNVFRSALLPQLAKDVPFDEEDMRGQNRDP